jgi:hypothetical protein
VRQRGFACFSLAQTDCWPVKDRRQKVKDHRQKVKDHLQKVEGHRQ